MARKHGLDSRPIGKLLLFSIVLLVLAVSVPAVVLATDAGGQARQTPSEVNLRDVTDAFSAGEWSQSERWGSLLDGGGVGPGMKTTTSSVVPIAFLDDMESGSGNWTVSSGPWQITTEWSASPTRSWSDSPGGNYAVSAYSALDSRSIDLAPAYASGNSAYLVFDCSIEIEPEFDWLDIQISSDDGSNWYVLGSLWGSGSGFVAYRIPTSFLTSQFKIRFLLESDSVYNYDGAHIDDVAVLISPDESVEETNPKIQYLGNWAYSPSKDASGGSVMNTNSPGAAATITFTGTGLCLYATTGPGYGIANVSLDGGPAKEVDLYSYSTAYQQGVYDTGNLSDTAHTLTIERTGSKNSASWGTSINLDAVDVWGGLTQAPIPGRVQQDDVKLSFMGPWATSPTNWAASGGSFSSANAPGSSVNLSFDGTYGCWVATTGPGFGKAQVSLDGGTPFLVDLYSSTTKYKQKVYSTGLLADTTHNISIYWTGQKNAAATGTSIAIDAFDYLDDLLTASAADPIPWRYQQNDPQFTLLGNWSTSATNWSASGGNFVSTSQTDAAILVNFTGTSVTLVGNTGPNLGQAVVTLDGTDIDTVEFWSAGPATLYKQNVYTRTTLSPGPHTMVIRCAGTNNGLSTGTGVNLDALDITGYVTQADIPARSQQENAYFEYSGAWAPSTTSWSLSGGTMTSVDAPGSAVNIAFDGTYCAWIAKKGPGYGIAKVSLDGAAPVLVDLYSRYDAYKQRVYNTGLLTDGPHTLSIYWAGAKNPAATGTRIDVDAIDYFGTLTKADTAPAIEWRYQDTDSKLTRVGNWTSTATWSASGGSLISTGQIGAAVVVKFSGTQVKIIGKAAPWYGQAKVSIDGGSEETADFYSSSQVFKKLIYTSPDLAPGVHTMVIKCASASISLDALDITGYLLQAPMTNRIQETPTADCVYADTWGAISGNWAYSGGNFRYTSSAGAKVTYTFTGTYLNWIAKTGPSYGKANVILYDGTGDTKTLVSTTTVDLYSAATIYKKPVYNTGLLADGLHTLVIECAGTKYSRSTGYTIGVDAFDVLGAITP